jgi:hypothetical protein
MTGIFGNLTTEGLEETQDRLGGFQSLTTGSYDMDIAVAYAGKSSGGAQFVHLEGKIDGRDYRETIYVTNKQGENYFLNKDDKTKKVPLPGFVTMDEICLVTTDMPLSAQPTEEKIVNVWDSDQKKELPKSVPVLTALLGKTVTLGIGQVLENKSVKDGAGNYQPIADTRTVNNIEKVFHAATKITVPEARANKAPEFHAAWVERNTGQLRDKRTIKEGGEAGSSGRPGQGAPAAGSAAPKQSLFGTS